LLELMRLRGANLNACNRWRPKCDQRSPASDCVISVP
jgi:hypothetical protein